VVNARGRRSLRKFSHDLELSNGGAVYPS
jgi:hypothetical protein